MINKLDITAEIVERVKVAEIIDSIGYENFVDDFGNEIYCKVVIISVTDVPESNTVNRSLFLIDFRIDEIIGNGLKRQNDILNKISDLFSPLSNDNISITMLDGTKYTIQSVNQIDGKVTKNNRYRKITRLQINARKET